MRDGQQDTRLAAERGVKAAYSVRGHSCEADDDTDGSAPDKPGDRADSHAAGPGATGQQPSPKPQ